MKSEIIVAFIDYYKIPALLLISLFYFFLPRILASVKESAFSANNFYVGMRFFSIFIAKRYFAKR